MFGANVCRYKEMVFTGSSAVISFVASNHSSSGMQKGLSSEEPLFLFVIDFVTNNTTFSQSNLSSEKCRLYSVENHEMGTKAQPMQCFCRSWLV